MIFMSEQQPLTISTPAGSTEAQRLEGKTVNALKVLYLSGVLVFYPGADIRMQREIWSKVLKILCRGNIQQKQKDK